MVLNKPARNSAAWSTSEVTRMSSTKSRWSILSLHEPRAFKFELEDNKPEEFVPGSYREKSILQKTLEEDDKREAEARNIQRLQQRNDLEKAILWERLEWLHKQPLTSTGQAPAAASGSSSRAGNRFSMEDMGDALAVDGHEENYGSTVNLLEGHAGYEVGQVESCEEKQPAMLKPFKYQQGENTLVAVTKDGDMYYLCASEPTPKSNDQRIFLVSELEQCSAHRRQFATLECPFGPSNTDTTRPGTSTTATFPTNPFLSHRAVPASTATELPSSSTKCFRIVQVNNLPDFSPGRRDEDGNLSEKHSGQDRYLTTTRTRKLPRGGDPVSDVIVETRIPTKLLHFWGVEAGPRGRVRMKFKTVELENGMESKKADWIQPASGSLYRRQSEDGNLYLSYSASDSLKEGHEDASACIKVYLRGGLEEDDSSSEA